MAKYDERDPRWIVEERVDGTNVLNWHWTENDCTFWSRAKLEELFFEVQLTEDPVTRITKLKSLEGEAFINNRKNKLIASYDFNLKLCWEGLQQSESLVDGVIEIPNLSDEQDDEDLEIRIQASTDSQLSRKCKEQIHQTGRGKIRSLLTRFIKELKSGSEFKRVRETEGKSEVKEEVKIPESGVCRLELIENFHANPQDIYECFVHPGKLQAFTQSPAKVEAKPQGGFSWFDGSITGQFVSLEAPVKLEMDWRFNNWTEGLTVLKLVQEGIPDSDQFGNANVREVTETGWRERIMQRIRMVFGYGL